MFNETLHSLILSFVCILFLSHDYIFKKLFRSQRYCHNDIKTFSSPALKFYAQLYQNSKGISNVHMFMIDHF